MSNFESKSYLKFGLLQRPKHLEDDFLKHYAFEKMFLGLTSITFVGFAFLTLIMWICQG
jgi:hypothetical protein